MHWEKPILQSQKSSRKQLAFAAFLLFIIPLSLFRITPVVPWPSIISAILFWPIGIYCLIARRELAETHAKNPIQILRFAPESIVWIYHQMYQTAPMGLIMFQRNSIIFGTIDGGRFSVYFADGADLKLVLKHCYTICPRASKGYSAEKEVLFGLHPENLLDYP